MNGRMPRRTRPWRLVPRRWVASAAALALLLLTRAVPAQEVPQLPTTLPEGEGRDLVQFHCAICHDLNIVRQQRLPLRIWNEVLDDMRRFGAVFTDAQRPKIAAYLVKHYGP